MSNAKIFKQFANPNNGGQERFTRDGNRYYISSNFNGGGFTPRQEVSRRQAQICLAHVNAPAEVVAAILA